MDYIRIDLPYRMKSKILALGAQSKGSYCFVKDSSMSLSDSFGDLADLENFNRFQKEVGKFKPEIIACDLHPEYISTKLAYELASCNGQRIKKIQHHKAHIASCIVDNNIKGSVIGVAFDGTGFGEDGNIWGGEFFVGSIKGFRRVAHLKYVPMPGSEAAVREPWRMALSYLYLSQRPLQYQTLLGPDTGAVSVVIQAIDKGINSPLTSSMGRLFDAVSSILGICEVAKYEGEPAIRLEKILDVYRGLSIQDRYSDKFKFSIELNNDIFIIIPDPIIKGIIRDLKQKLPAALISLKFHNAVCRMILDVCSLLRKRYKLSKVCFSGGVFQNNYIVRCIKPLLESHNFKAYGHNRIPTNDSGIALGQAGISYARN